MEKPLSTDELHAREEHPDFEYTWTRDMDTFPGGQCDWHRNRHAIVDAEAEHKQLPTGRWMKHKGGRTMARDFDHYGPMTHACLVEAMGMRFPPGV